MMCLNENDHRCNYDCFEATSKILSIFSLILKKFEFSLLIVNGGKEMVLLIWLKH